MKSLVKFIFDWIFITNYRYTVLKNNNSEFKAITFISFINANFIILFINLIYIYFEIKAIKPYWFIIITLFIFLINHIYYFNMGKKNSIEIPHKKNDTIILYLIFFLSMFLNFYSYYYLIENIN